VKGTPKFGSGRGRGRPHSQSQKGQSIRITLVREQSLRAIDDLRRTEPPERASSRIRSHDPCLRAACDQLLEGLWLFDDLRRMADVVDPLTNTYTELTWTRPTSKPNVRPNRLAPRSASRTATAKEASTLVSRAGHSASLPKTAMTAAINH
jgi:hypothetical protein